MLKIRIVCVGELNESFFREAQLEYIKRLSRYCDLEICQLKDEKTPANASEAQERQIKQLEGGRILEKLRADEFVTALDLSGRRMSSEQLAAGLGESLARGRRLCYVIGGSLGLSPEVLRRADARLCLSDMTFTHNMARLILLEQLYRGFKINAGEPYHK